MNDLKTNFKEVNYFEYYQIEKNSNLFTIAKENNINPNLLAVLNGLDPTDYVFKNQMIMLPKNNYSYYITKEGDTISLITEIFSTSINNITKENPAIYLKEGQLIVNKL
ncbi:MAG: LysM peptidoglycan-binding domain-containing protein [Bacilli bacterium]|nr:LysM peptidoglycan-binding domain-containing protein [Bacilli bacterium]